MLLEVAHLGVRVPGGHAIGEQHFANHLSPATHPGMAIHGERTHLASTMALDAFLLQDGRDVVVGDSGRIEYVDFAALHRVALHFNRLARHDRIEHFAQVKLGGLGLLGAVVEAIIQRAPIDDLPLLWGDHQNLAGAFEAQAARDDLRGIHEGRQRHTELFKLLGHILPGVLRIGVDHQELDALIPVGAGDAPQLGIALAGDGTSVALNVKNDRFLIGVAIEFVGVATMIRQPEVLGLGGRSRLGSQGRKQRDSRSETERGQPASHTELGKGVDKQHGSLSCGLDWFYRTSIRLFQQT
ncbi:MAG: hypothetical protein RLZZ303_2154 [Candidatus Hydrogenedentota bacterium]